MSRGLLLVGEQARAFEHDVHSQLFPRKIRRILVGGDAHVLVTDADRTLASRDRRTLELSVDRVVLEQVSQRLRIGEIIDPNELKTVDFALRESANNAATDATETVNRDFRGHGDLLPTPWW